MSKLKRMMFCLAVCCVFLLPTSGAFAATGFYFNGGLQTGNYYGASGNIECDELEDVGNDVSVWVMVAGQSSTEYIQAGWGRHWDQSRNYHFYQNNGDEFYHRETGVASPGSTYSYKVERTGNTWSIYIDGSIEDTVSHSDLGWTAGSAQFFGEVHDSEADQSPGTVSDPVTSGYLRVKSSSGTWSDASFTNTYEDLPHQRNNADEGDDNYEQWDNRYS